MYDIKMPRLSDSMEVGQIVEWKVEEGDEVEQGQVLADIESDKATMELECFHDGTMAEMLYEDGEEAEVGEIIARIAEPDEEVEAGAGGEETAEESEEGTAEETETEEQEEAEEAPEGETEAAEEESPEEGEVEEETAATEREEEEKEAEEEEQPETAEAEEESERVKISPYARKLAEKANVDIEQLEGSGPGGRIIARDIKEAAGEEIREEAPAREKSGTEATAEAEPLARAVAEKYGVDLSSIDGSGVGGRITVDDVLDARSGAGAEEEETKAPQSPEEELPELKLEEGEAEVEEAPFRLRTQARHVIAAKHAVPHFYVTRGADVTELMKHKDELKENFDASVTHVVMLAVLKALSEHPDINRSYDRGRIIKWNDVNLGLAVDTEKGLTVAVLREAQDLGLEDIATRTSSLVEKARSGKLQPEERRHPTFVITNLGMFDVEEFQAILNPPAAVTVAVSSALPTPVVRDGGVEAGTVMKLTLSCDHRIVDGVGAAKFLSTLKDHLETPESLLKG